MSREPLINKTNGTFNCRACRRAKKLSARGKEDTDICGGCEMRFREMKVSLSRRKK